MANITIQDVRQQYPGYDDLSDEQLADKLHSKFYSDMDKNQFYSKIGFSQKNNSQEESSSLVSDSLKGAVDLYTAPVRAINRGATDIGAGIATGLENVYGTASELLGKPYARHDMGKLAGIENPNLADTILQKQGQYMPATLLGGPVGDIGVASSILPALARGIGGAGAYGFTQAKEGSDFYDKSKQGLIDASLATVGMGVAGVGSKAFQRLSKSELVKSIENYFKGSAGIKPPKYSELGAEPDPADAFKIQARFGEPTQLSEYGEQQNPLMSGLVKFADNESQFTNLERQSPEFLRANLEKPNQPILDQEPVSPLHGIDVNEIPSQQKQLAENVYQHLSGGRNLDESAKYNASHMKNTFERIEKVGNQKYDTIFHAPEFVNETGEPKTFDKLLGDKETKQNWVDMADSENKTVFDNFVTNPTLQNAQKAKTELAVEKRDFQKRQQTLTPEEKIRYKSVIHRHDVLEKEMNNIINSHAPHLEGELQNANDYWHKNVANWYDKNLFRIVKGRETNPSSATLASIFKNPEPGILKVANELGEEGKKGILLHGIGKAKGNYSPKLLKNILPTLEEKGLLPHITNDFQSRIQELGEVSQQEKNLADSILKHQKLMEKTNKVNTAKLTEYEKALSQHEKQKNLNENLIERLQSIQPSPKALPNYQSMKVSYPKAEIESEKIVSKAGERHEQLQNAIIKYQQKVAENQAKAAEHTTALAAAAATSLLTPKSFLTGYRVLNTAQRGIGKIVRAIKKR